MIDEATKLLKSVLTAEAAASRAESRAQKLRDEYCKATREFVDGEIAEKLCGMLHPKWTTVRVKSAKFYTSPFGVVYTVAAIDRDGKEVLPLMKASGANIRKKEQ